MRTFEAVLIFGYMFMLYAAVAGSRYPDTGRFYRALNYRPLNVVLRVAMGIVGVRGLAEILGRHGKPWLRDVLHVAPLEVVASVAGVALLALLGYGMLSKRVQGAAGSA